MPRPSDSRRRAAGRRAFPGDDPPTGRRFFAVGADGTVAASDAGGAVVWRGRVGGGVALDVLDIGVASAIVLLDWMSPPTGVEQWHPFENLMRIDDRGSVTWRAELPHAEKSYTSVSLRDDGVLVAHAWAGDALIDLDTGNLLEYRYTK